MRSRSLMLVACGIVAGLLWFGGVAVGKGSSIRRLDLPGGGNDLPFSHVVVAGKTIYVAGTLGLDPQTGRPPDDPTAEARLALDGIRKKLELAGAGMDDLVSVQVFCPDLSLYEEFNAVYRTYFEAGFPTRSFIGSGPLLRGARFEINGIATRR